MHQVFSMKELGFISYFLGISVTSGSTTVLSQKKYAQDILLKAGMLDCKACSSPISVKPGLPRHSDEPFANPPMYRSIVEALQYLTITRPDISFAVNQLYQHMHNPTVGHYAAVKRLLRFNKGTISHGLTYTPSSFDLHAYSDSNWAADSVDRKSTLRYYVFLGSNLISWSSKKQATFSQSSTEIEYRSLAHTVVELAWLGMLRQDFSIVLPTVPLLWCDNVSSIALASNPVFHSKSKHIEVDCHFVRDRVLAKKLVLHYIPTIDQLADIFTKPLSISRHSYLKDKLNVSFSLHSLQGNVKDTPPVSLVASFTSLGCSRSSKLQLLP
ncbi:uncharacterized protein LOC114308604 [Camellia sinensis]|uniref:uncharacterized protein LOC114308604 n=1 Tax=Camellia sinensis TaxID=4442 RepID=UPI001035921E|nr:uncharacterized protein LOC114308604 [Camellia sinensis]